MNKRTVKIAITLQLDVADASVGVMVTEQQIDIQL